MDESDTSKLDAIVGAALKALALSGADDAFVGAFAASHRQKVAGILGLVEQNAVPTDLLVLVTQAVKQALEASPDRVQRKAAGKNPVERVYVTVNGKPTSLSLSTPLLDQISEVLGGRKQTRKAIAELAQSAPKDVKNRSGWVEARMMSLVGSKESAPLQRH